jgi:hypothetical protein
MGGIERDWLTFEDEDQRDLYFGLCGVPGHSQEDAMTVLKGTIITLARGGDVSPELREDIAMALSDGVVRLVPDGPGNKAGVTGLSAPSFTSSC